MTLGAWLDVAEELAIGACGMTAIEFDAATPKEVQWRIDAMSKRSEAEWQRVAQLTAWMYQVLGVKITANRLLGKPEPFDVSAFVR